MASVALSGIITPTNVVTATSTTTLTNKTLTGAVMNGTLGATTPTTVVATTVQASTTMGVGGATPSASGSGITFPATQSASTNANTLDDYDEYTATSSACTGALTVSTGWKLTKVGNVVTLTLPSILGTTTAATSFSLGTVVPAKYRPTESITMAIVSTSDNSAAVGPGLVQVSQSTGTISIYRNANATTAYGTSANSGSQVTTFSWAI